MQERKMRKQCYARILALGDANSCDFWVVVLNNCSDTGNTKVSVAFQNSHCSVEIFGFTSHQEQHTAKQYGSGQLLTKWKYASALGWGEKFLIT